MSFDTKVTRINPNCLRIQIAKEHTPFRDSALNRYKFIDEKGASSPGEEALSILWEDMEKGSLKALDKNGEILFHLTQCLFTEKGALVQFELFDPEEDWMGFGDQTRERLFHRGFRADCIVSNVTSYLPVPLFFSTRGYGILVNTTYHTVFDMGAEDPSSFQWYDRSGRIDFYVFSGRNFKELLNQYTLLTGKPELPPLWSFGLWYICRTQANDAEVMNDARLFREYDIPCDVIGLEPGWMEKNYDYSTEKEWSSSRFPLPQWQKKGEFTFIKALKRMGYKLELWLCNDYDLSFEEERRIGGGKKPEKIPIPQFCKGAEEDEHFASPVLLDRYTKADEPWFKHLEKFVDWGADFFKQDGASQVNIHPDRLYRGNGMTDMEMHNLYPLCYSRQMNEGFAKYTNRRPVVFTVSGWAGFQHYCGTWTGDTGGRLETLGAMLNTSCVGHSWCTNDMEVAQKEGIHFGYLQPWSQINSWTYFRMPWLQGEELFRMHQEYARLRSRLIPYIYSYAYRATRTAEPLLMPLAIEFQEDKECRKILHEYLLGRDLLVTIYKKEVYFPRGVWRDFWTGEIVESKGEYRTISWPEERGGGLFLRSGSILPLGPVMSCRGEKEVDQIELLVFPGDAEFSSMKLYEDDGVSFEYRNGKFAITELKLEKKGKKYIFSILPDGSAGEKKWSLRFCCQKKPDSILSNGVKLEGVFNEKRGELFLAEVKPGSIEIEE